MNRVDRIAGHLLPSHTQTIILPPADLSRNPTAAGGGPSPSPDSILDNEVYIMGSNRTALGAFNGSLAACSTIDMGSAVIKAALQRTGLKATEVQEVIMGCVLTADLGQAPARQAALAAGLPNTVPCTTINKMCASGMKAIMMGHQLIKAGHHSVVICGGMESMTNAPYYAPAQRFGARMGDSKMVDGIMRDGLSDAYNRKPMGCFAEKTARERNFTREQQDAYSVSSYERAIASQKANLFKAEITPMVLTDKRKKTQKTVDTDDEPGRFSGAAGLAKLNAAFEKGGTVTAGNSSVISDGACAMILITGLKAKQLGLVCCLEGRIRGFADAAHEPEWFTTAPALAIPLAVDRAGLKMENINYFEINEAFAVVALVNMQLMQLPHEKVNVWGGGVSMGHPIGASGARIVTTLLSVLKVIFRTYCSPWSCSLRFVICSFVLMPLALLFLLFFCCF